LIPLTKKIILFGVHVTGASLSYNLPCSKICRILVLKCLFITIIIIFSGQEVGPLLLEVPVTVQASSRVCATGSERQNTDFSSGLGGISVLEDSSLLKKVTIGYLFSLFSSSSFSIVICNVHFCVSMYVLNSDS
jgi:hypothetical protein